MNSKLVDRAEKMLKTTKLSAKQIADKLEVNPGSLRYHLCKRGHNLAQRAIRLNIVSVKNIKHSHLTKKVMTYFLKHTKEEVGIKFGLTHSEIKSLFTLGYRKPEFKHLRKDHRRGDKWTVDEKLFLVKTSGLRTRGFVASKLKRGTYLATKEELTRLNVKSRYLNGITLSQAKIISDKNYVSYKVKAGPGGLNNCFRSNIVPWVELYSKIKNCKDINPVFIDGSRALAKFQMKMHNTKNRLQTLRSIESILRQREPSFGRN